MNLQTFLNLVETKTQLPPRKSGEGYSCRCPAHQDTSPSLSVSLGTDGKILLNCHSGCSFDAIIGALGVPSSDLFPETKARASRGATSKLNIVATYDYRDESGRALFQVCRTSPKGFRQRRPDNSAKDGWAWNLKGVRLVPYRLPELIAASGTGQTLFVVEGEKDVASLEALGFVATCNSSGAGKWQPEFASFFKGAKSAIVLADKDTPGRAHAAAVAASLHPVVPEVKLIELPDHGGKSVKDVTDFLEAGGTKEELLALIDKEPRWQAKEALTPASWFRREFPSLAAEYGDPVHESNSPNGNGLEIRDLSEDFMAATLGEEGSPETPTVFLPSEDRFYTYKPESGLFEVDCEEEISARLSAMLLKCARACQGSADTSRLGFGFRDSSALAGVIKRAKGLLRVSDDFFNQDASEFLPVANGILRLSDRSLLAFSPLHRYRSKLAVNYDATAYCPRFLQRLLQTALEPSDISLFQFWAGMALTGANHSQKILILSGTAGGGKSTLVSVIHGIIGEHNVGTLRTELLGDRFEIGRLAGKTLLYGADVPEDFLSKRSASSLKSLTGGELMTAEFKNSNASPQLKCRFNIVVTSNSRLTVYLEGDTEAWRRRLMLIAFERPKPSNVIPDLAGLIVREEGSGVLNWMLDGLDALKGRNWQFPLSERQQRRVDDLLLESDSHRVFAVECLVKDTEAPGMTKAALYEAYLSFCEQRGWQAMPRNRFGKVSVDVVAQNFGLSMRGDILGEDGKQNNGWKKLRLRRPDEVAP